MSGGFLRRKEIYIISFVNVASGSVEISKHDAVFGNVMKVTSKKK